MALRSFSDRSGVDLDAASDFRRYAVYSRVDDDQVGTVDDVLTDESGTTRYLSVSVKGGDGRRVLVPVGHATADRSERRVWVEDLGREGLHRTPAYTGDPATVDADYEHRLTRSYDEARAQDGHYSSPHYRNRGWGHGRAGSTGQALAKVDRLHDVKVASDDPDPRGWKVVGRDGTTLGKVDHLLGDTERMRVVYLVVDVDRKLFGEERHVLVPVGHAALDRDHETVRVDALDRQRLDAIEPYREGGLDRDRETRLLRQYDEPYTGDRRYDHPRYGVEGVRAQRSSSAVDATRN